MVGDEGWSFDDIRGGHRYGLWKSIKKEWEVVHNNLCYRLGSS